MNQVLNINRALFWYTFIRISDVIRKHENGCKYQFSFLKLPFILYESVSQRVSGIFYAIMQSWLNGTAAVLKTAIRKRYLGSNPRLCALRL